MGTMGTWATLRRMSNLVRSSLTYVPLRQTAVELAVSLYYVDALDTVRAIRQWVCSHYRLIGECDEMLVAPEYQIDEINHKGYFAGDCDDCAMLVAALLASIGIPVRFRAIKITDTEFEHVFTEARIRGVWYPVDPTVPERTVIQGRKSMVVSI